jgi:hypothetical protein
MHVKLYKIRSLKSDQGKTNSIDMELEFEGERAFVIWDSITVGGFMLKARVEIDPLLLQEGAGRGFDFYYRGELVLPRPENN